MDVKQALVDKTDQTQKPVNNTLGLFYMFLGFFLFSATDALAKLLTETIPPLQVVWSRQTGLFIGIMIIIAIRGTKILHSHHPKLQISRGVLAAISATLFIIAISFIPLADAVAITFVAPLMVTILGATILKEPVGIRRWTAVIIGFVGTLIVIRPGLGVMHPAALLLVIAAAAFAGRQIISRSLSNADKTITTVAYTAIVSWSILCIPLPFIWETPTTSLEIIILVSMSLLAAAGEIFVIMALDKAHAVVVTPVHYSLIIWGTAYGFLIFGQLPDMWTMVGAVIIILTGLYTINRERLASAKNK